MDAYKKEDTIFYQDFFGISSNENSQPPMMINSDDQKPAVTKMLEETNPMFRSSSGSFRYMRFKIAGSSTSSTPGSWRSRSLSVMASKSKSRWQVFMSGFGSEKFPGKMDLVDIKTRQLYASQSTTTITKVCCQDDGGREDSGDRRSATDGKMKKKVWWRLVEVLGTCGGGYARKSTMVVV